MIHMVYGDKITIPSGKLTKNYGKSQFLMGKSTISMAIFNSYVKLPEGILRWGLPNNKHPSNQIANRLKIILSSS